MYLFIFSNYDLKNDGGFFSRMFSRKPRTRSSASEGPQSPLSEGEKSPSPLSSPEKSSKPQTFEYTKEYEYEERAVDDTKSKGKKGPVGAFTYEKDTSGESLSGLSSPEAYDKSPGLRKATGVAYSYAPGPEDAAKLAETAIKRKHLQDANIERGGSGDHSGLGVSPARSPVQLSTTITTPEKDKGFDVASFGNENRFVSPVVAPVAVAAVQSRKTPSPALYAPRPWSAASSNSKLSETNTPESRTRPISSSIFSQPGYTTSFLDKPTSPIAGSEGFQNKHFLSSSPQPFSSSTPLKKEGGHSLVFGTPGIASLNTSSTFATPIRVGQTESMITHPGTVDSQLSGSQEGSHGRGAKPGKRPRAEYESSSDSDTLHSSSSSSESEDEFPQTQMSKGGKKGMGAGTPMSSTQPKIIMTTTKEKVIKDADGLRHDVHEKVEDLTPGGTGRVLLSTTSNQVNFIVFYVLLLHFSVSCLGIFIVFSNGVVCVPS